MASASRSGIFFIAIVAGVPFLAKAATPVEQHPTKEGIEFFEKQIRPILVHNCYECHSGDPKKAKGKFVLDTRAGLRKGGQSGSVITPGDPNQSLLIEAVRYESLEMPPTQKLPDELIEKLVQWVEMGAPDPRSAHGTRRKIDFAEARKYWAFRRPKAVAPPSVKDSAWPATDIDRFIRARQEAEGLHPVADADPVTWIRRVTFDLTGLPPAPQEIDSFLNDKSLDASAAVVERLLMSPRFGECWGRHWLDVVRYGESTGKERNLPYRYAWRYRNWVIDALNNDKPYDRFVLEQLAGDLLHYENAAERNESLVATGFLALGPKSVVENEEQYRYDVIDDQIDVTSRAFLAMTVACARCHDHKYDPIPTTDYYALAGIFRSTDTMAGIKPGRKVATEIKLLALSEPRGRRQAASGGDDDRLEKAAVLEKQLDHLQTLVKPPAQTKKPPRHGRSRAARAAAKLRVDNMKKAREEIKALEEQLDAIEAVPLTTQELAMGVREGIAGNSHVLNHGELKEKGPEVPRDVLTVLKTSPTRIDWHHSGRLELARWIASADNPLTARVFVNRIWQHLFGQGLVSTVDNFGALGEEPSNPQLLDALAVEFVRDQQWSVKKLIRSIVLSRVYRLASTHDAENYSSDPSNKFLWRMTPRRLDAEEIRDAMLAASGALDLERPTSPSVLQLDNKIIQGGKALQDVRKPTNVRSVYLPILRGLVPDVLQVFDAADPNLIVGQRDVTTVAPQALFMMNNPFVIFQADRMARRVLSQKDLTQDGRIALAYRLALGRPPDEREKSAVKRYLADYRHALETANPKGNVYQAVWASLCQTLFASGEFRQLY
jgi:Protein of unknown function (DUF1553)/Protein of unknown function (DUF1549)/Planctomycete cytochrome C